MRIGLPETTILCGESPLVSPFSIGLSFLMNRSCGCSAARLLTPTLLLAARLARGPRPHEVGVPARGEPVAVCVLVSTGLQPPPQISGLGS